MAARAKDRGIATAQSSIIWFNPTVSKPNLVGLNGLARVLRSAIAGQAASAKRCFVDSWSILCPVGAQQQNCFDTKYWKGGTDFVGHPSSAGYDLLTQEFFSVLGRVGTPGGAEILEPMGLACGKSTTVKWLKETVAGATCGNWYRIQIDGGGGNQFDGWFQEGDVCSGSECTAVLPKNLPSGTFSARIQTRNTRGDGPWTADESFDVVLSAPKRIAKTFGPMGQFFVNGGLAAELEWKPVTKNTARYRIEIASARDGVVLDETITGVDECSGNRCVYAVENPLP
ncbi:MAG: hypothetical protein GY778_01375, partial [bacterium]|nr:hypothetical protein [bacterium]